MVVMTMVKMVMTMMMVMLLLLMMSILLLLTTMMMMMMHKKFYRALRVSPAVTRFTVYRGFALRNSWAASCRRAQKMTNLRKDLSILDFSRSLKIRFHI